jgi:hypothetical protein
MTLTAASTLPSFGDLTKFQSEFVRLAQRSGRPEEQWKEDLHDKPYAELRTHMQLDLVDPGISFDTCCEQAQAMARGVEAEGRECKAGAETRRKARAAPPLRSRALRRPAPRSHRTPPPLLPNPPTAPPATIARARTIGQRIALTKRRLRQRQSTSRKNRKKNSWTPIRKTNTPRRSLHPGVRSRSSYGRTACQDLSHHRGACHDKEGPTLRPPHLFISPRFYKPIKKQLGPAYGLPQGIQNSRSPAPNYQVSLAPSYLSGAIGKRSAEPLCNLEPSKNVEPSKPTEEPEPTDEDNIPEKKGKRPRTRRH